MSSRSVSEEVRREKNTLVAALAFRVKVERGSGFLLLKRLFTHVMDE